MPDSMRDTNRIVAERIFGWTEVQWKDGEWRGTTPEGTRNKPMTHDFGEWRGVGKILDYLYTQHGADIQVSMGSSGELPFAVSISSIKRGKTSVVAHSSFPRAVIAAAMEFLGIKA